MGGDSTMREPTWHTVSGTAATRRWDAVRVAHPVRDLDRSAAFYREVLGLPVRGGFTGHDDYSGAFFGLPGGGELELTLGPVEPRPGTDDDLLVLYAATPDDAQRVAAEMAAAGAPTVRAANPYWGRWGRTFLDPDGYAVVVAAVEPAATPPPGRAPATSASSTTHGTGNGCGSCSNSLRIPPPNSPPTCTPAECSSLCGMPRSSVTCSSSRPIGQATPGSRTWRCERISRTAASAAGSSRKQRV